MSAVIIPNGVLASFRGKMLKRNLMHRFYLLKWVFAHVLSVMYEKRNVKTPLKRGICKSVVIEKSRMFLFSVLYGVRSCTEHSFITGFVHRVDCKVYMEYKEQHHTCEPGEMGYPHGRYERRGEVEKRSEPKDTAGKEHYQAYEYHGPSRRYLGKVVFAHIFGILPVDIYGFGIVKPFFYVFAPALAFTSAGSYSPGAYFRQHVDNEGYG